MKTKESKMIIAKEYAEMRNSHYTTVMNWLRRDLVPGAIFERGFCRRLTGRGAPRENPRRKECERNEPIKSIKVGIGKIWGNVQGHHAGSRRWDQAKNRSEARLQPVWQVLEIALTER